MIEMSHEINASSVGGGGTSIPANSYLPPTPPQKRAPPPASKRAEQQAKKLVEESMEELEKREKTDLRIKIEQYLTSPILRVYFEDSPIRPPAEHAPIDAWRACYGLIKKVITMESKRYVCDNMFETAVELAQDGAQNFLGMDCYLPNGKSFADFCLDPEVKNQMFQPELEEISIELSDWLVPDPKVRLLFKLFRAWKNFQKIKEIHQSKEAYDLGNFSEKEEKEEEELPPKQKHGTSSSSSSSSTASALKHPPPRKKR